MQRLLNTSCTSCKKMTDKVDTQIIKYIDDQFYLTRKLRINTKERMKHSHLTFLKITASIPWQSNGVSFMKKEN